jgi:hypothetical protein
MKTLWTALFLLTVQLFTAQENEVYADGVFNFEENKTRKYLQIGQESEKNLE